MIVKYTARPAVIEVPKAPRNSWAPERRAKYFIGAYYDIAVVFTRNTICVCT